MTATNGYALPNSWELARERLALLEACHDPASIRRALALGVEQGWRCLEAGGGHGSFARWLAGRTGYVLAVDQDTRMLEELDVPGLHVQRLDLAADELPQREFDLVHTRCVLLHVRTRDEVLAKLAGALRPGGVLLLEEDDTYPIDATATGPYREAWRAFSAMMEAAGLDPHWARTLPQRLDALGLEDVQAEVIVQQFRGGDDPARFWSMTWDQARERGVDGAVLSAGQAALADPGQWFTGPAKVVAWGRRAA
jgi:SAM-dependent methyltransferase